MTVAVETEKAIDWDVHVPAGDGAIASARAAPGFPQMVCAVIPVGNAPGLPVVCTYAAPRARPGSAATVSAIAAATSAAAADVRRTLDGHVFAATTTA